MIQSMTGYGKSIVTFNQKKINVEIKSLNSKTLDLSTRIAPLYREKEMEIRQLVSNSLVRGKVDLSIWVEREVELSAAPINVTLIENYYRQIRDISARTGIHEPQDWYAALLRMTDVTTQTDVEILSEEEWHAARTAINEALNSIVDFRQQEGKALYNKFT